MLPLKKWLQSHQLAHDAANRPDVDSGRVVLADQDFGRSVPESGNIIRVSFGVHPKIPAHSKISNFNRQVQILVNLVGRVFLLLDQNVLRLQVSVHDVSAVTQLNA